MSADVSPPVLPYQWSMFVGSTFSLQRHWSLVWDGFTENLKSDLLWLITLRGVKVRNSLRRWGYIDSGKCASCPRQETIDHCFLHCLRFKDVWAYFVPILSIVLGVPFTPNLLFVFFFAWPPGETKRTRISIYLVKSVLYSIWTFRKRATFRNAHDNCQAIIHYIQNSVKQRIFLDFTHFSEDQFRDIWLLPGFCTVENGLPITII